MFILTLPLQTFPCLNKLTCSNWVVNVDHVGPLVPSVVVRHGQCWVKSNSLDWAMELKEAKERGGTRSTLQPDDYWGLCRVNILDNGYYIGDGKETLKVVIAHSCRGKPEEHV